MVRKQTIGKNSELMNNSVSLAPSSQGTHLSNISLLRVIAMVSVVFYHCLCYYGIWSSKFVMGCSIN